MVVNRRLQFATNDPGTQRPPSSRFLPQVNTTVQTIDFQHRNVLVRWPPVCVEWSLRCIVNHRFLRLLLLAPFWNTTFAAETGDFDGDGRLSVRDVFYFERSAIDGGVELADGSFDAFAEHPCSGRDHVGSFVGEDLWNLQVPPAISFFESLRRNVSSPNPHWLDLWGNGSRRQAPLLSDGSVELELCSMSVPGGQSDRVILEIDMLVLSPLQSFVIIVESGGLLLPPSLTGECCFFPENFWWGLNSFSYDTRPTLQHLGDLPVSVSPAASLITNGRVVVTSSLRDGSDSIAPGEYRLRVEVRLPKGTPVGSYEMSILPGSEVLLANDTLTAPDLGDPAQLIVENELAVGFTGSFPPLSLNGSENRVLGNTEFRVVDANGSAPAVGDPVAAALPGETVTVRVQMRTDVPLNYLAYSLRWPNSQLSCELLLPENLFHDPIQNVPYRPRQPHYCINDYLFADGGVQAEFHIGGSASAAAINPDEPLDYFRQTGEWTDISQLILKIPETAGGGEEIPLRFRRNDPDNPADLWGRGPRVEFVPYSVFFPCDELRFRQDNLPALWNYEVLFRDAFIQVLGDDPPSTEPAAAFIQFALGDVRGRPGELVEVPVFASTNGPLFYLRLALPIESSDLQIEEIEVRVWNSLRERFDFPLVSRGGAVFSLDCLPPPEERVCEVGIPSWSHFHESDNNTVLLDLQPGELGRQETFYPGEELTEIAKLRIRISHDAQPTKIELQPAAVHWKPGEFLTEANSGGNLSRYPFVFAQAASLIRGSITVDGPSLFVRGDVNADGNVDLSDAVTTLRYLFGGSLIPACFDAADADDNGQLQLTDAVFHLGVLFRSDGAFPPPHPRCGVDRSEDGLNCEFACSP